MVDDTSVRFARYRAALLGYTSVATAAGASQPSDPTMPASLIWQNMVMRRKGFHFWQGR